MFRRPVKEINAEFAAEERYLDSIQRVVREACAAAGMQRKMVAAVLLAVEEGATNIIRHAYLYEKGTIRLRVVIYKKLIAFSLIDSGRSFQPEGSGKINLERLVESGRRGGLGFYMIQKIMDQVEYISAAGFNELRMIKRLERDIAGVPPIVRRMFSLRVKFSVWTFFIMSLIIGAAFYYTNTRTTAEVYQHLDETVTALGKTIADQASGYMINGRSDVEFDELAVSFVRANPMLKLLVLTDSLNIITAHSTDIQNIRAPYVIPEPVRNAPMGIPQHYAVGAGELNYLSLPIVSGERSLGVVHITYSSEAIHRQLTDAREKILLFTGLLLTIGILGIYGLSNYFVRPIVKITQRVRRFSSGDLESELPLEGADEFFEIASALNDMMTRLARDRRNVIERERMAKEIEFASQIQKTLLPSTLPRIPGLEIDAYYRAASMVGGDLYDVFEIDPGRYCLVVADVSGKGVPASLVMSMLRTVFQITATKYPTAKGTLVAVNEYLSRNMPPGMFITVMAGFYEVENRRFSFVSAGHNPMLYFTSRTKEVTRLNPAGMPLGVPVTLGRGFAEGLEEVTIEVAEGDLFILFTDGITEATNREGKQYGTDRFAHFISEQLRSSGGVGLAKLSDAIVTEIDNFAGFGRQKDDITFIIGRTTTIAQGASVIVSQTTTDAAAATDTQESAT